MPIPSGGGRMKDIAEISGKYRDLYSSPGRIGLGMSPERSPYLSPMAAQERSNQKIKSMVTRQLM